MSEEEERIVGGENKYKKKIERWEEFLGDLFHTFFLSLQKITNIQNINKCCLPAKPCIKAYVIIRLSACVYQLNCVYLGLHCCTKRLCGNVKCFVRKDCLSFLWDFAVFLIIGTKTRFNHQGVLFN